MVDSVKIKEIVQAGDIFLAKFDCPFCNQGVFQTYPFESCHDCKSCFKKSFFEIPKTRSDFRLLSGTRRKRITYHKKTIHYLKQIQDNNCAYCDETLSEYHIDHVIPLSVGGSNDKTNLCLSCPACNLIAGSLVFYSFMDKKIYLLKKRKNKL